MVFVSSHLAAELAEEDLADFRNVEATCVQEWCLSRAAQYRCRILALHAMRNTCEQLDAIT